MAALCGKLFRFEPVRIVRSNGPSEIRTCIALFADWTVPCLGLNRRAPCCRLELIINLTKVADNAQAAGLDIGPPEVLAPLTRPSSQPRSYDDFLRILFAPDDLSRRAPDNLRRSDAEDVAEPESAASVPIRRLTSRIVQY